MYQKKQLPAIFISLLCLLLLMLSPQTAIDGAFSGLNQCIRVVIPSLFPYFVICSYMNTQLAGLQIPGFHYFAKLLRIPPGGESILLLGLIGGYPVGAQAISSVYQQGSISKRCAQILLGYCNNAGPAFIFGVTSCLFSKPYVPWVLWLIQFLSIISTGLILPHPDDDKIEFEHVRECTVVSALQQSIKNMASVCGWVVLFKVLTNYISICTQQFPHILRLVLSGLLELSNGCISLTEIPSEPIRFLLCSIFLAFGGVCVLMQTSSSVGKLGLGYYIPGKTMQTLLCLVYSLIAIMLIYPNQTFHLYQIYCAIIIAVLAIISIFLHYQKSVEIY